MKLISTRVVTLGLVALWSAASLAFAQIDPEAQVILDRYEQRALEALAARGGSTDATVPIDTLRMVSTIQVEGDKTVITTVADRLGGRVASVTRVSYGDGIRRTLYGDGTVQSVTYRDGEWKAFPRDEAGQAMKTAQYEALLASVENPEAAGAGEVGFARYDGPVNYGGVLEGEQLTLDASAFPSFPISSDVSRISVVYTPDGLIAGLLVEEPEGQATLTVYEDPTTLFDRSIRYKYYTLDEGETTLRGEISTKRTYNEPLDEAPFILPEAVAEESR